MHTVELLEEAIAAVKQLGYQVRFEALEGGDGGVCEFGGRRRLFLDVAQAPVEHLHAVLGVLREDGRAPTLALSNQLAFLIRQRAAA